MMHVLLRGRGVLFEVFKPGPSVPRVLKHPLTSAANGRFKTIEAPPPLHDVARLPIVIESSYLQHEGLFDVHSQRTLVAHPSVFVSTKGVGRLLAAPELLRVFDVPVSMAMDKLILVTQDKTRATAV